MTRHETSLDDIYDGILDVTPETFDATWTKLWNARQDAKAWLNWLDYLSKVDAGTPRVVVTASARYNLELASDRLRLLESLEPDIQALTNSSQQP